MAPTRSASTRMPCTERIASSADVMKPGKAFSCQWSIVKTASAASRKAPSPGNVKRITRLESDLGTRLLRRNTRALSLTDRGAAFYEGCRIAIEATEDALSVARDDQPLSGLLRIAAPHGLGETLLPPVLLQLRQHHPALKVDVVLNDRLVDPVTEGVDLSLRLGDISNGRFAARRLGEVRRILVASPAYLEQHGAPEQPQNLIRHAFARVTGLFTANRLPLTEPSGTILATPVNIVANFTHWRPLYALLMGGGAIGVLQESVCRDDLASGRLLPLLLGFSVPGFACHALFASGRPVPPRLRLVLSLLEAEAGKRLGGSMEAA